jgi:hypothetical protein
MQSILVVYPTDERSRDQHPVPSPRILALGTQLAQI